jgi:hypothetical protein
MNTFQRPFIIGRIHGNKTAACFIPFRKSHLDKIKNPGAYSLTLDVGIYERIFLNLERVVSVVPV